MGKGFSGHKSPVGLSDEWITPPYIVAALGRFDLDTCSPVNRPYDIADVHYTVNDNGLVLPWSNRVWLNPPYSEIDTWMKKMADHANGCALVFARTDTKWFRDHVWDRAEALLFLYGRLTFLDTQGKTARYNGGAPSVIVAYGENNVQCLKTSGLNGKFVKIT